MAVAAVVGILDVLKVVLDKSEVEVLGIGRGEEEGRERLGDGRQSCLGELNHNRQLATPFR